MEIEIWKDVVGYEKIYEISSLGRVKSYYSNKILKLYENSNGHLYIDLHKDKKKKKYLVHRLVAIAFIPNENQDANEIDHINRVKTDNRLTNLRWVTRSQNEMNKGIRKDNKTGCKGIYWSKEKKRWYVQLTNEKKVILGGYFTDKNDAINRRKELEEQYFKEFAYKENLSYSI